MAEHYDLVVIGSGPAGEKGAAQAAYFDKKVVVVEREPYVGGASINSGTVPSKTLRETALYFSGLRQRGLYGIDYSLREGLSVRDFMFRERTVVEIERKIIRSNLDRHGIELLHGTASISDPHTVRVYGHDGPRDLSADVILIATGSSPFHPPGIPFEHPHVHDSDEILFEMQNIPNTMAVVGGGVIGCEYASIFAALGVEVTLIEGRDRLMPFVDGEIAERLTQRLDRLGFCWRFNTKVAGVEPHEDSVCLQYGGGESLEVDLVLYATGRQSNVAGLGLEALGVALGERRLVLVNDHYQTNIPNIYAAGDVIGFPALASTSMEQARVAMSHAFNLRYKQAVSPVQSLAVWTIPEVAMVGLTEERCKEQGIAYLVGRAYYENSARGQIIGDVDGMIKLIFATADKKLVGVHLIGESSAELVHIGAAAMMAGQTIDVFVDSVYNYPTLSDSYKYAAYDGLNSWNRARREDQPAAETGPADAPIAREAERR